ncbi:MAG: hypothetical protein C4303_00945 [candidate division GAL15 bacterium]
MVALVLAVSWPLHRLVVAAMGSPGGPTSLPARAARYAQAELEYLRSLDYARFRTPSQCMLDAPPPLPTVRVLPEQADVGEPVPEPPLQRAEVRIEDEPVEGGPRDGCGPRRVQVVVYGPDPHRPLARAVLLRVKR